MDTTDAQAADYNWKNSPVCRHAAMVKFLAKDGADILKDLTPTKCHEWHMATGVSGEAGELLDAVKRVVAYNKPIDRENVIEELGDIEFYMEGLRDSLGITRDETLEHNHHKLMTKRYPNGFSNEAAIARADKIPEDCESLGSEQEAIDKGYKTIPGTPDKEFPEAPDMDNDRD